MCSTSLLVCACVCTCLSLGFSLYLILVLLRVYDQRDGYLAELRNLRQRLVEQGMMSEMKSAGGREVFLFTEQKP